MNDFPVTHVQLPSVVTFLCLDIPQYNLCLNLKLDNYCATSTVNFKLKLETQLKIKN